VPDAETLASAYRLAQQTKVLNAELARVQERLHLEDIALTDGGWIEAHVRWTLTGAEQPSAQSWDEVVWEMVQDEPSTGVTSDDERCW
jgi:hypothetical protein